MSANNKLPLVAGLVWFLSLQQGIMLVFPLDAATYLVSALCLSRMSFRSRPAAAGESILGLRRMVADSLRFVAQHDALRRNTLLWPLIALLTFGAWTLIYGLASLVSTAPGFAYAVLEGALGAGAVLGGVSSRWRQRFRSEQRITAGTAMMGVGAVGIALLPQLWRAAGMIAFSGIGNMQALIPSVTLVQGAMPRELLGRVIGCRRTLFQVGFIVANGTAGCSAAQLGVLTVWGVIGATLVILSVGMLVRHVARWSPHQNGTPHSEVSASGSQVVA